MEWRSGNHTVSSTSTLLGIVSFCLSFGRARNAKHSDTANGDQPTTFRQLLCSVPIYMYLNRANKFADKKNNTNFIKIIIIIIEPILRFRNSITIIICILQLKHQNISRFQRERELHRMKKRRHAVRFVFGCNESERRKNEHRETKRNDSSMEMQLIANVL